MRGGWLSAGLYLQLCFISQKSYSPIFLVFPARENSSVTSWCNGQMSVASAKANKGSSPSPPSQHFIVTQQSSVSTAERHLSWLGVKNGLDWNVAASTPSWWDLGRTLTTPNIISLILKMEIIIATHERRWADGWIRSRWWMWKIQV